MDTEKQRASAPSPSCPPAPREATRPTAPYGALLARLETSYDDPALHIELSRHYIRTGEFDRALASAEVAAALQPRRADPHHLMGWLHERAERTETAIRVFRALLLDHPDDVRALTCLGRLLSTSGEHEEGLSFLRKAVRRDPASVDARRELARIHASLGKDLQAVEHLQELRNLVPQDHEIPYLLGQAHSRLGSEDRALLGYQTALEINPEHTPSRLAMARIYLRGGLPARARQVVKGLLAPEKKCPEAHILTAESYEAEGAVARALAVLFEFQTLFPEDPRGYEARGRLHISTGDLELARSEIAEALKYAPRDRKLHSTILDLYLRGGQKERALEHCAELTRLFPQEPWVAEAEGDLQLHFGDLEEALTCFERALALSPQDASLLCKKGRTLIEVGRYDDAVATFTRAREIAPDNPEAQFDDELIRDHRRASESSALLEEGREALAAGEVERALNIYREVLLRSPDNLEWTREVFAASLSAGRFGDALDLSSRLVVQSGDRPEYLSEVARFHLAMGHFEKAYELHERAVSLRPGDVDLRVGVLRSLQGRMLLGSLSPDRLLPLVDAYEANLEESRQTPSSPSGRTSLAHLELGLLHLWVSSLVHPRETWQTQAAGHLQAARIGATLQVEQIRQHGLMELALRKEDLVAALPPLSRLLELSPDDPRVAEGYLGMLPMVRDIEEEDLQKARELREAHGLHGPVRALSLELERASAASCPDPRRKRRSLVQDYRLAAASGTPRAEAFLDLGLALMLLSEEDEWFGAWQKAEIAFTRVTHLEPGQPWGWWGLLQLARQDHLSGRSDLSRVASIGRMARRRFHGCAEIHALLGGALSASPVAMDREEGLRALLTAVILDPECTRAHVDLADHYRSVDEVSLARFHDFRALSCPTAAPRAGECLQRIRTLQ